MRRCAFNGPAFSGPRVKAWATCCSAAILDQTSLKRRTLFMSDTLAPPPTSTLSASAWARVLRSLFSCASGDGASAGAVAASGWRGGVRVRLAEATKAACSLPASTCCTAGGCAGRRVASTSRYRKRTGSWCCAPSARRDSRVGSLIAGGLGLGSAGYGGHLHAAVLCPPLLVGVVGHRLLGAKGRSKHLGRGHVLFDQGAGHGQRALGRQLQVIGKTLVAPLQQRGVVGKATHHQHLVTFAQVHLQRLHQALEQLPAFRAQLG